MSNSNMTLKDAEARIAELEAQLATASKPRSLTMKVSEKGAISIYGLGRFPVTAYVNQWERILAHFGVTSAPVFETFVSENSSTLARK